MSLDLMIYIAVLLGWGVALLYTGVRLFGLNTASLPRWEKLPRHLWLGAAFALVDLFWVIPHASPLLPDSMKPYLVPAALLGAVLAYHFLDYLFSRALGGFLILLPCYLLHESFTIHTPWAPLLALCCYIIGITGIFFAGKPYLMRDLIRACAKRRLLNLSCAWFSIFFGILCLSLGIIHIIRG